MVALLCQIFNASTHSHKWGPKERPTLDNIGPHDIIIDHQSNSFPIREQRELSRLFTFHYCLHMPCIYCVYIMMSIKDFDSDSDSDSWLLVNWPRQQSGKIVFSNRRVQPNVCVICHIGELFKNYIERKIVCCIFVLMVKAIDVTVQWLLEKLPCVFVLQIFV